jgi:hypothetical protein
MTNKKMLILVTVAIFGWLLFFAKETHSNPTPGSMGPMGIAGLPTTQAPVVKWEFNWVWHVESCETNKSYDGTINKAGTFAILEQAKIEAGGVPCPVGHPVFHPSWDYDWRTHTKDWLS